MTADANYLIDYENVFKNKAQGIDQLRMSIKLGYSYNVGRLSFPFEVGYYFLTAGYGAYHCSMPFKADTYIFRS